MTAKKDFYHLTFVTWVSLFIFLHILEQSCLRCDRCVIAWLAIKVIMCSFPLDDMVVEVVCLGIHIYWLDLRLECQLWWFTLLFVRGHRSFVIWNRVEDWDPLWHLGLLHAIVLHLLVESHHVLFAFPCVSLPWLHRLHQAVSVVREVELIGVWRYVHVVVHATRVKSAHLIDTGVEVDVITCSECPVWWVKVLWYWSRWCKLPERHLPWARHDHIFIGMLFLTFGVVMMVMVVHVTKVWIDEAVSLDLGCRLKVEMLSLVHPIKVAPVTWCLLPVVVMMTPTIRLGILLWFLLLFWNIFVLLRRCENLRGIRYFLQRNLLFLLFFRLFDSLDLLFLESS